MNDWNYCVTTLPKVSRTFALNISVLKGDLHKSILVAYLFCRTIDTVEDACKLESSQKIKLLLGFASILKDTKSRSSAIDKWINQTSVVDGNSADIDLLKNTKRVFNVFESIQESHKQYIISSVCTMAQGMAYFQKKIELEKITLLEDANELEEYCYFVAGAVGEMLCNLFINEIPDLSIQNKKVMRENAVSFGLGLQITNISKDIVADRGRGWSYVPKSYIESNGLTSNEFHAGKSSKNDLKVLKSLLNKTVGHLNDALGFILAIPRSYARIRLFCIWPLWMAMETVAELHDNHDLLKSNANVKISRDTVKRILRRTPFICWSNSLLKRSFSNILITKDLESLDTFNIEQLKGRLNNLSLDKVP
jgi:farnesyl-diphosphate farnesyltransferase